MNKDKKHFNFINPDDFELTSVLYCIENTLSGDKYVGMTTRRFIDRMNQHVFMHSKKDSSGKDRRSIFYEDLNKHGPEIFKAYVLIQNDDEIYLREEERRIRLEDDTCYRYAERDLNRDTSKRRGYSKIICTSIDSDEVLEFSSAAECARQLGLKSRTSVTHAISDGYNLKKKYKVTYE